MMNASSVFLSSLRSYTYFTVKVNVQVLSPIKQFDVDSCIALIEIFSMQNDLVRPPVTSCLSYLLHLGVFEMRFLLYEVALAS